ncbi:hypothetical protein HYFRA_00001440 [Hymenoscyphus fraxineus]|uniref:Fun14 family protein n=1 Tax=Hymenoscyphus fraxineus TaxID=746836 RepID=A0A9N9PME4_9HELO|nr:hypothetical protein HYFRA_00001440 [Hymenoscyphus fraxineus]
MTTLLRPLLRPQTLGLGLGISLFTGHQIVNLNRSPIKLDSGSGNGGILESYRQNAKTPVVKRGGGLNPGAVRQISGGSIAGLCTGLLISTFSKTLTLLIGLMILGIQFAQTKGINLIPTAKLQKYISSIDLRSAVQDNAAFKISFGTTFVMAAFMKF